MFRPMSSELVEISFDPGAATVKVEPGITILAASEVAGVEIITGCTAGMCGTDPVQITEGLDRLSTACEHEKGTLERMGLSADFRLSCSARLVAGPVHVKTDAFRPRT